MKIKTLLVAYLLLGVFSSSLGAAEFEKTSEVQTPNSDLTLDLSLEDVLNLKTTIATKRALTTRESPGIISIVTREEIANSGARDLYDILALLVPGFSFNYDVPPVITGPSFRGIWGIEGKILFLVDGVEANDDLFGRIILQNHFPSDLIDHIEVIRGPGSAIYGNYASIGVISIFTRDANLNGVRGTVLNSQMKGGPSHRDALLGFGKKYSKDIETSLFITKGYGNFSDREYKEYFAPPYIRPDSFSMVDNFTNHPFLITGKMKYNELEVRSLVDLHEVKYPVSPQVSPLTVTEHNASIDARYNIKPSDKLTVTPRFSIRLSSPMNFSATGLPAEENHYRRIPLDSMPYVSYVTSMGYHRHATKLLGAVNGLWQATPDLNFVGGLEYVDNKIYIPDEYYKKSLEPGGAIEQFRRINGDSYVNRNYSLYSQGTWNTIFGNITGGFRYERSYRFGSAFVPRLGITKVFGDLHTKAMYTRSFRTPFGIQTDSARMVLRPETATNFEFEAGYRLLPDLFVQANVFDIDFKDMIIFQVYNGTTVVVPGYANAGSQRTRGVEAELRYQNKKVSAVASYSYYKNIENKTEVFSHPIKTEVSLGIPNHRFNIVTGYHFNEYFSIHPSASYFGTKYSYDYDINRNPILKSFDPAWIVNLNLRAKNVLIKGLEFNLGVFNLLDTRDSIVGAYQTYFAPRPIDSRSWMTQLSYTYNL